MMILY